MSSSSCISYDSSLLHISLLSLTSFSDYHRELIVSAVKNTSKYLIIYVSCKDIDFYGNNYSLDCWDKVHNLLCTFYVSGSKVSYELNKPFLEINVIFENWCGYSVELGQELDVFFGKLDRLLKFNENRQAVKLTKLPTVVFNTSILPPPPPPLSPSHNFTHFPENKFKIYKNVAVGGTFDHIHAGHKILLTMSAWITRQRLICGVTGDSMLENKKYKEFLEPIETRIAKTNHFLNTINRVLIYEVVPIYDVYGPTVTDPNIQALVVSKETISGAYSINEERKRRGLDPLDISVIEVISSSNASLKGDEIKNLKLSSTFIREIIFE
ncbi:7312_t:CDS:2 [Diversispora eburnea]|uniref:7312_t:CDS:1 n=1 Tax=Diversispora eburnea TaxID=1213867 RepID=A0A9N9AI55_9GLOM|nr:7312_t:CDS:2 [Diversispora eburnea]